MEQPHETESYREKNIRPERSSQSMTRTLRQVESPTRTYRESKDNGHSVNPNKAVSSPFSLFNQGESNCLYTYYLSAADDKLKRACLVCRKIKLVAETSFGKVRKAELGCLNAILSIPCRQHQHFILSLLERNKHFDIRDSQTMHLAVHRRHFSHTIFLRTETHDARHVTHEYLTFPLHDRSLTYLPMTQIGLLRRWKDHCDRYHGVRCRRSSLTASSTGTLPQWLIDTWTQSLVSGKHSVEYVALSYVWGRTPFFRTNRENQAQLQKSGAFSDIKLPQTIRDALVFVERLGERNC